LCSLTKLIGRERSKNIATYFDSKGSLSPAVNIATLQIFTLAPQGYKVVFNFLCDMQDRATVC